MAGYRLMPALQGIFGSMALIRFYLPSLVALHEDLRRVDRSRISPAQSGATVRAGIDVRAPAHEIRFESVSFWYPDNGRSALREVSLLIEPRQTVGFIGRTGCGKTTLVDLLAGLLSPTSGTILADGVPLTVAILPMWRSRIGYVSQSIVLSDTTIAQNIAFGVPAEDIDRVALERAARAAHAHDFVERLAEGYETRVGERGVRLSGGERQRIAIARALYRDPPVLVLDEATSALDTRTEEAVMEAIRGLAGRKTVILIAHRLSTLRECDIIHVLDQGCLIASGSFAELTTGKLGTPAAAEAVAHRTMNEPGPDALPARS
jgi:ATP-binding cassette, subfamily B, bacterial PglK